MSVRVMSLLESARRKFFMNSTYIMSRKKDSNVFWFRRPTFLGSRGRNECKSHELARIGEKKIFHELDVHHV